MEIVGRRTIHHVQDEFQEHVTEYIPLSWGSAQLLPTGWFKGTTWDTPARSQQRLLLFHAAAETFRAFSGTGTGLQKVPHVGNAFKEIIFLCVWHHLRFSRTRRRTGPDSSHALKKGFRTCISSVAWTITAFLHKLPNGCMEIENHTYTLSSSGSTNQFACKIVISTLRFIFCSSSKRLSGGGGWGGDIYDALGGRLWEAFWFPL